MTAIILRRPKLGRATKYVVEKSQALARELGQTGIAAVIRNDKPLPFEPTLVFRWGTTSNVNCRNVVNSAEAIHRVNDKAGFRQVLMNAWADAGADGQPLCPYTYGEGDAGAQDILEHLDKVVVRPRVHAQGKHVYLCETLDQMADAIRRCGAGFYVSQYIAKVAEYRVTFVQGRVVWVAKKTPGNPNDVAWNVARGGRFDNVRWDDWPLRAVRVAREAFVLSGLDFGAVDVMVDAEGRPYVLEINSAPSQTSPYRQECMAKAFNWVIQNGKQSIPITQERGGYRKFIHPALTNEAVLVQ